MLSNQFGKKLYKTISLTESIDDGLALDIGLEIIAGGKTSIFISRTRD